jgi:hypothetical protein
MEVDFTYNFGGQDHDCSYCVTKSLVSVRTPWGTKSTQLGEMPVDSLARMMAVELASEAVVDRLRAE